MGDGWTWRGETHPQLTADERKLEILLQLKLKTQMKHSTVLYFILTLSLPQLSPTFFRLPFLPCLIPYTAIRRRINTTQKSFQHENLLWVQKSVEKSALISPCFEDGNLKLRQMKSEREKVCVVNHRITLNLFQLQPNNLVFYRFVCLASVCESSTQQSLGSENHCT